MSVKARLRVRVSTNIYRFAKYQDGQCFLSIGVWIFPVIRRTVICLNAKCSLELNNRRLIGEPLLLLCLLTGFSEAASRYEHKEDNHCQITNSHCRHCLQQVTVPG